MFTAVDGMSQEDIDELAPTENALSLLEKNSGPIIKELLHYHLKAKGCMAYLQPGMCNSLKSLIIASYNQTFVYSTAVRRKSETTLLKRR